MQLLKVYLRVHGHSVTRLLLFQCHKSAERSYKHNVSSNERQS